MHGIITRQHFADLVKQRQEGQASPRDTEAAVAFALDLFARLGRAPGAINVADRDLVGLAAGTADLRVVPMPGGLAPAAPRPGRGWAIHTLEANGNSTDYLAGQLEVFLQEYLTPRAALVFDVRGGEDLTLHAIAEMAGAVYRRTGKDNDVIFGAVGAPRAPWRLGLTLVLLIPIP